MRNQRAHIIARIDPDRGKISASQKIGKRRDRTVEGRVVPKAQPRGGIIERRRRRAGNGGLVLVIHGCFPEAWQ